MALLMALKRDTIFSSSTLFTNLLNRNRNPALSAVRSSSYGAQASTMVKKLALSDPMAATIHALMSSLAIAISGPRGAYEVTRVEDVLFVRMEMPGIDREDVKLWVEYGNVHVKGEGKKESRHECNGISYSGSLEISSQSFQPDQIKAELKNGVLRMLIPKTKESRGTGGSKAFDVKIK